MGEVGLIVGGWLWERTGAVVDLVVDDHVEVFLWEVSDLWYTDMVCGR